MALARIITRSQACSRELALDLLARGYAVEIVSPDAIPDNIADLELRVDTGPGDQLIANVEAHDGGHSTSLEFLHHLKAPMGDFIRRTPEFAEPIRFSERPAGLNTRPSVELIESPAAVSDEPPQEPTREAPRKMAPEVLLAAQILEDAQDDTHDEELDHQPDIDIAAPMEMAPTAPVNLASDHRAEIVPEILPEHPPETLPTIRQTTVELAEPLCEEQPDVQQASPTPIAGPPRPGLPLGWYWPAAITFAAIVVLALVLGFGMRRTGKTATLIPGASPAGKTAPASPEISQLSPVNTQKDIGHDVAEASPQVPASATPVPATKPAAGTVVAAAQLTVTKAAATTRKASIVPIPATKRISHSRKAISHRPAHADDDLVAPDTVTYLDQNYKPATRAKKAEPCRSPSPEETSRRCDRRE